MIARIYSPAKNAMQSGKARTGYWVLQYLPETPKLVDPLMGYTSSTDTNAQVSVEFDTKEQAIAFARENGIAYRVDEPHTTTRKVVSYSDNFRSDRKLPWTH